MPTWPASLPQHPLIQRYEESPDSAVLRTEMDTGPAKTRLRSTATTTNLPNIQYPLTDAQKQAFEAWFRDDIARGALPFDWPRPRGGTVSVLLVGKQPYTLQTLGSRWLLTINLEIQP